ncbi:MAG: DUF1207 domain-containing protein [Pirellulales bacterium]
MIIQRSIRGPWLLALVAFCLDTAGAFAQITKSEPPVWSPYRENVQAIVPTTVAPTSTRNIIGDTTLKSLRTAQLPAPCSTCEPVPCAPVPCLSPNMTSPYACAPYVPGSTTVVPMMTAPMVTNGTYIPQAALQQAADQWGWNLLPDDVIFHSYMAGVHEPRMSSVIFVNGATTYMDITLGGRMGILRYGTPESYAGRPQGWELDIEGAAFPRLNLSHKWDLDATDFRFGIPLTYGREKWQFKFAYYHLSSHIGDEFAIRTGKLDERINYSRDALVLAASYYVLPAIRLYAEGGWAFHTGEFAQPWEFQFGLDWARPGATGLLGIPFAAVNGHIRQELDYGGNVVFQAGWLWRGMTDNELRLGFHYYNGRSSQFQFYNQFEQQIGAGLWYEY